MWTWGGHSHQQNGFDVLQLTNWRCFSCERNSVLCVSINQSVIWQHRVHFWLDSMSTWLNIHTHNKQNSYTTFGGSYISGHVEIMWQIHSHTIVTHKPQTVIAVYWIIVSHNNRLTRCMSPNQVLHVQLRIINTCRGVANDHTCLV